MWVPGGATRCRCSCRWTVGAGGLQQDDEEGSLPAVKIKAHRAVECGPCAVRRESSRVIEQQHQQQQQQQRARSRAVLNEYCSYCEIDHLHARLVEQLCLSVISCEEETVEKKVSEGGIARRRQKQTIRWCGI